MALAFAVVSLSVTGVTAYRGVNAGLETLDEGSLDTLAWDWGANLLRVYLPGSAWCPLVVPQSELAPCCETKDLRELDWLLDACEQRGIRVIIDLHQFPGYYYMEGLDDKRLWTDPPVQDAMIEFWETIAGRYAERGDVIYGYDLLNEPHDVDPDVWLALAQRAIDAIREVDTRHAVIVESVDYAHPSAFSSLRPVDDDNAIYSFHFYEPHQFTHQGIREPYVGLQYPSKQWTRDYLEKILRPVQEFQMKYGARILAGEFSVVAWAPPSSRKAYLQDVMDIFEAAGYDYTYWNYRATGLNSLVHEGVPVPWNTGVTTSFVGETESLLLFKKFLSRNERRTQPSQPGKRGRCVFDESHWGADTATNATTRDLAWRLSGILAVEQHDSGELDLTGVTLLATGSPYGRGYTDSEIRDIHEYVQAGGALLFYAGENPPLPKTRIAGINDLLAPFGIQLQHTLLASSVPFWVDPEERHAFFAPAVSAAPELVDFDTGSYFLCMAATLSLSAPAVPVLVTDDRSWIDLDWDGTRDPEEPWCPCPVVAVARYGSGRVAVVANQAFQDNCNWAALRQVVTWLLRED